MIMNPNGLRWGRVSITTLCCLIVLLFANVPDVWSQGELPSAFPITLRKNLISQFSVGESYEDGIQASGLPGVADTVTEAGASFAYNWRRKRAEYAIDYRGSGRHYRRHSSLDVFSHVARFESGRIATGSFSKDDAGEPNN